MWKNRNVPFIFLILLLVISSGYGAFSEYQHYDRGIEFAAQGKLAEARKEFKAGLKIDSTFYPTRTAMRICDDLAKKIISQGVAVHIFKGFNTWNKGNLDEAYGEFNRAISLAPDYAYGYSSRGFFYFKKSDYQKAILDYNRAIKLMPDDVDLYYHRGVVYHFNRQRDKALEDMQKAKRLGKVLDPAFIEVIKEGR